MNEITTYADFRAHEGATKKLRWILRKYLIAAYSVRHHIQNSTNWIRMIFYHHVFEDEQKDFERQLRYLANFGEFISIDRVCEILDSGESIDGRYFCVSFDDGFYNTYSKMMPITYNLQIPVIIFLPTQFMDLNYEDENDRKKMNAMFPAEQRWVRFLQWNDCREMLDHMVTFGSHTTRHADLSTLSYQEVESEMAVSKKIIEENLGIRCDHFACPYGRFDPDMTAEIAQKLGYRTVATSRRGKIQSRDDLYNLNREHLIASYENFQLKYFFG